MNKKRSPMPDFIRQQQEEGRRLASQKASEPIHWAPGEREALIDAAIASGKVRHIPAIAMAGFGLVWGFTNVHRDGRHASRGGAR